MNTVHSPICERVQEANRRMLDLYELVDLTPEEKASHAADWSRYLASWRDQLKKARERNDETDEAFLLLMAHHCEDVLRLLGKKPRKT